MLSHGGYCEGVLWVRVVVVLGGITMGWGDWERVMCECYRIYMFHSSQVS